MRELLNTSHHGLCTPLFSLHSQESGGIGEYSDLLKLLPFCQEIGFDTIQLLPLNDTGKETSPYMALSAFALHPIYIALHRLTLIERVPHYQEKITNLRRYTQSPRVEYAQVGRLKNEFLREYASCVYQEIAPQSGYQAFCRRHKYWLEHYALFKTLKEKNAFRCWEDWEEGEKNPSPENYAELLRKHKDNVDFHTFLQYLAFTQLAEVKEAATAQKIFIKGDIPILISRDSADLWNLHIRPYFFLDLAAGAPPDMYAKEGQYWGFPVYNWPELEKNGYDFWKERLACAEELYHLYRLDHVVGFFRLWAIPLHKKALEGSFLPKNESEWIPLGKKILEMMLSAAPLLPIAEDLGTVPPATRTCLRELGIPGTKVMRWERRWNQDRGFIPLSDYPRESMTTVSTHDSETLQLWWRNNPEEARLYAAFKGWEYQPLLSLDRHLEILQEAHHSNSAFHINLLQEYLALIPELTSSNPDEERINIPGKILETNWTYKFRPSIEELQKHALLKEKFKKILAN